MDKNKIYRKVINFRKMYYTYRQKIKKVFSIKNVTAFFLSCASIVVSVAGIRMEKNTQMVAEKELEILENDREAHFSILSEEFSYEIEDTTDDYEYSYYCKHTVYNTGGRISGAYLDPSSCIYIYITNGFQSNITQTYRLPLSEFSYTDSSFIDFYDADSKSFNFYLYEDSRLNDFCLEVCEYVKEYNPNIRIITIRKDFVTITYSNYENIKKELRFEVNYDSLEVVENDVDVIYLRGVDKYNSDSAKELAQIICNNISNESTTDIY